MAFMFRYLPIPIAVVAVLATGVVHGLWTDRWADREAIANRLDQLPMVLGDWHGKPREFDATGLGPISGCLTRYYVNQKTGAGVTMSLVCGRPGPVAIHTPDVCYVASGFQAEQAMNFAPPLDPSLPPAEFKTAQFVRTRAAEQTALRVFWSWNAGGTWQVSESPRFAFARQPVLYKLHLVREQTSPSETLADDPCVEFMQQLLPELQKRVISTP
jgi:hypothetical protein